VRKLPKPNHNPEEVKKLKDAEEKSMVGNRKFCFVCNMMPCDCAYTDHSD